MSWRGLTALALVLALAGPTGAAAGGPAAAASIKPGARLGPKADPKAEPKAAAAPEPRAEPKADQKPDRLPFLVLEGLDPEVTGFLFLPGSTRAVDGGAKPPWDGAGSAQLRISEDSLDKRQELVLSAAAAVDRLMALVQRFYDSGGTEPSNARARLKELSGAPLDEARAALLQALKLEERRLFFIQKALDAAAEAGEALPGAKLEVVEKRAAALRDGKLAAAVDRRIGAYRALAAGLVHFIDNDRFAALENMKVAGEGLPDVAVAQVYLGSLYYLFQEITPAVAAWKRALDLDPTNEVVKAALKEYGRKPR